MDLANHPWLLRLLGVDPAEIRPDTDPQFLWQNAPSSWSVFVMLGIVIALCAGVIYLYRREINTCPSGAKWLLAGLRLSAVLLLVGIYLDPSIRLNHRRILDPSIAILRDASQSMDLGDDRYADESSAAGVASAMGRTTAQIQAQPPSRAAIVNHILNRDDQRLLRDMSKRGTFRVLDFAGSVENVALKVNAPQSNDGKPPANAATQPAHVAYELPPLKATGTSTDLRRALQESLTDRLLAAVVMFTDGQHTVRETAHEDLKQLAAQAKQRGVPLLIVGVGDPARPRNLAVTDIYADQQVWQDDPFEIQTTLRGQGMEDESVEVSLIEKRLGEQGGADGAETIVAKKTVKLPAGSGQARVAFKHSVAAPGRLTYLVRATVLPGESNDRDNEPPAPVELKVLGQRARVLLISGGPSWEYQHLLRLLKREKSVDVSSWLQTMDLDRDQDGTTIIRHLPRTREELFAYDVVALLDPNPEEFNDAWMSMLREFVGDHAGGLLFMAGPKYSSQFLSQPRTQLIRQILPIELGDVARLDVEQLLDTSNRRWQLGVVPSNADHPIMRFFEDTSASLARWQHLPGIYWSLPTDGPRPGAKLLLERADPTAKQLSSARALIVTGMYGGGRTVFLGFQGTWRWRRTPDNSDIYKRFWLQTVRYLVEGRSVEGKRRIEIETERTRYTLGERVSITARLKTAALKPLELPKISATLLAPPNAPESIELKADPRTPGQYSATLLARHRGHHELTIESPGETGSTPPRARATFSVVPPSVELERPWLNKPLLVDLAKLSGGRYFELTQLDQLAGFIPDRKQVITVPDKPLLLRDSMRMGLLGFLIIVLGTEWAVRKHFKLM